MSSTRSTQETQTEKLQAALACLDLSLESELGLYRQQTLQAVSALALPEAEAVVNTGEGVLAPKSAPILSLQLEQASPPLATDTPESDPASTPGSGPTEIAPQPDSLNAIESETALPSQRPPYIALPDEDPEKLPEPYSPETVAQPEALERFLDPSIEDYLESSEALLKHLDRSETRGVPKVQKPPQSTAKLPFKVLGAVLVLALLAGLGAVLFRQFSRSGTQPSPQTVSPVPSTPNAVSPTIANPSPSALPGSFQAPSPNSSSPAATAQSTVPSGISPSPVGSVSPPAQPVPLSVPTAQTATPTSPEAAPTSSPQPTPSAALPSAAFYIVVAPYEGDASYERAKRLVPDAFIADVKGKKQIQLSFLEELGRAQRLVNDLKNQGFSASIVAQN